METISEALSLREWESLRPGDGARSKPLIGFRFANDAERDLAARLTNAQIVELLEMHDGLHIRARSHIGRIQVGTLTLTIQPKVGPRELLALLRYAFGLRHATWFDEVSYATTGELFADLLIRQLHAETRDLLERGLVRTYVLKTEQLEAPRGRIDFAQLARRGGLTQAQLPCAHHPRSSDNVLNQVLLSGLSLAMEMANDRGLRAAVARQHALVGTLASPCVLSSRLLERADRSIHRLVAMYSSILELIEALYYGTLLDINDQTGDRPLPGFLFDMNRFWQRLLERFLRENLHSCQVESEHGLTSMMRYVPGHNPKRRRGPTPRPDFAIRRGRSIVALLDAKYRDVWEHSLPRDMLYQLSVYALSQPPRSTAAILFPASDVTAEGSLIEIRDPIRRSTAAFVALRPVQLSRLVELIQGSGPAVRTERARFAEHLAFGDDWVGQER